MFDLGLHLTSQAIRCQPTAMPHDLYLVRLIHHKTKRAFPGERLWTGTQLTDPVTVRLLRVRNREGCDVYIQPYAAEHNPGYILVEVDDTGPAVIEAMRSKGHDPCVVLQTSPGNLQAWVQVSATPIQSAVASWIGKQLADVYGGDLASADWRHLGRLAGFTIRPLSATQSRPTPPRPGCPPLRPRALLEAMNTRRGRFRVFDLRMSSMPRSVK